MTREPDWDLDSLRGRMGERTVAILRESALMGTAEVKTDRASLKTGRLFVETACRHLDGVWRPSGIATKAESFWFVPAPGAFAVAFETDALRWLVRKYEAHEYLLREMNRGSHPTRGVLIPWDFLLSDLDEYGGHWR